MMKHARRWRLVTLAGVVAASGWAWLASGDGSSASPDPARIQRGVPQAHAASAGSPPPPGRALYRIDPAAAPVQTPAGDSHPVSIDRRAALDAARTGAMLVSLPDGTRYPVRYERSESAPEGNWTFIGRVDTRLGALASVITFGDDGVFGTLPTPDGETMKLTTRAGQVFLQPAGWSIPPGADPSRDLDYVLPSAPAPAPATVASSASGANASDDAEATITILAVYTKNLSQLRGSAAAARAEYQNLVAVMNQAHIDSGSRARFEIADFVEVNYPAGAWNESARADIIDDSLPDGTDLHALRDGAAADLVALIRPYATGDLTCGISQFPGEPLRSSSLDRDTGFSVTAVEACAPLVYAHEIGHNLGLMHDRETVAGPHGGTLAYGAYPFAFGHRQLGPPGFATVMAYDSESRPRLGYFSHPGSTLCGGVACGDAERADSVRAINLIADAISRFRDPPKTISVEDHLTYEYGTDRSITVSLSSPAPPGGIMFDIEMEAGSATAGADVGLPLGVVLQDIVIPEGWKQTWFQVRVLDDDLAEATETIDFRLRNVRGDVAVRDAVGTLSIVDYDETVRIAGAFRFPPGAGTLPAYARMDVHEFKDGVYNVHSVFGHPPDYRFSMDIPKGSHVALESSTDGFAAPDVILERVDVPMTVDVRLSEHVLLSGGLKDPMGHAVSGIPVILWNPNGDGAGYYVNYPGYTAAYDRDVLPNVAMQLELRDPPAPYVRQVVEIPPLGQAGAMDIALRTSPSLTMPHVTLPEGTAADGARTFLLTASLSVPRTQTGVSFDIQVVGDADAQDFQLPQTHFTIPKNRTRVEVPIVIVGDDLREPDETIELRITNVQGAAWNPGPGSVRIATDDAASDAGRCVGGSDWPAVRRCE